MYIRCGDTDTESWKIGKTIKHNDKNVHLQQSAAVKQLPVKRKHQDTLLTMTMFTLCIIHRSCDGVIPAYQAVC